MNALWLRIPEYAGHPSRAHTIEALLEEERAAGGRWCAEGLGVAVRLNSAALGKGS